MMIRKKRKFPALINSAIPTKHKYGADVTLSYHTDTYKPTLAGHGIDAEILAFKYNLQLTILISPSTDEVYEQEIKDVLETGRFSSGIYFRSFLEDIQGQVDFYRKITGKDASYWSYGNGIRDHDEFVLSNSLLTRNSATSDVSYDFETRIQQRVASAFNYDVRDHGMVQALTISNNTLDNAINTSGWYNDFSHWHWAEQYGDKNQFEVLFSQQSSLLENVYYVSLGSGEAVEYMWLRKQFKRGGLYQDGNELVLISDVRNDVSLPFSAIDTTLSVEIDLSGTLLEGKEILANADILKVDADKFIVQVPYSKKDGFRAVRLSETLEPKYLDLSLPVVTNATISSGTLSVTTDKPTKIAVFSVPIGGGLYQAELVYRSNELNVSHEIAVGDTSSKEIYIGAITSSKQSILHKIK